MASQVNGSAIDPKILCKNKSHVLTQIDIMKLNNNDSIPVFTIKN